MRPPFLGSSLVLILSLGCSPSQPAADPSVGQIAEPDEMDGGKLVLGSPSFLAGIPGVGQLTLDEIRTWLDNPANHKPLNVILPWHLRDSDAVVHVPRDNPFTRAKIELGRQLFLDKRLARTERFACVDCHPPLRHFAMYLAPDSAVRDPLPAVNRASVQPSFGMAGPPRSKTSRRIRSRITWRWTLRPSNAWPRLPRWKATACN